MSFIRRTGFMILLAVGGCSGIAIDPSPSAIDSNAATLVLQSCEGYVMTGVGKCTVKENSAIASEWRVILPKLKDGLIDGELTVKFQDQVRSYPVGQSVISVPWTDFFGQGVWRKEDAGIATATARIRFKDPNGIERIIQARGHVILFVLAKDYDEMPIDSGFQAWGTDCKIGYSTSARSAIKCK